MTDKKHENRDYRTLYPLDGEGIEDYCARLEKDGEQEMFIRKALRAHFGVSLSEMSDLFENYPEARMRHVELVRNIHQSMSRDALTRKIAKDLAILEEKAASLVSNLD